MKTLPLVFTVAATVLVFAVDPPKPSSPTPKAAEPQKPQPPTLTLDGKSPQIAPNAKDAVPIVPPETLKFTSPEDTGPVITFNEKPGQLAPGIYTASPFTGIVVVPSEMDIPIAKQPGATRDVIPQREPELKLTPRTK